MTAGGEAAGGALLAGIAAAWALCVTLFWRARRHEVMRYREPALVVLMSFSILLYALRASLALSFSSTLPCGVYHALYVSGLMLLPLTFCLRARNLLRRHLLAGDFVRRAITRVHGKEQRYLVRGQGSRVFPVGPDGVETLPEARSPLMGTAFTSAAILFAFVTLIGSLAVQWSLRSESMSEAPLERGCRMLRRANVVWLSSGVSFILLIALFGVRLRRYSDQFGIRRELAVIFLVVGTLEITRQALYLWLFSANMEKADPDDDATRKRWLFLSELLGLPEAVLLFVSNLVLPWLATWRSSNARASLLVGATHPFSSLEGVLTNSEARNAFHCFLVESFCPENLLFWDEVNRFRSDFPTDSLAAPASPSQSFYSASRSSTIGPAAEMESATVSKTISTVEAGEALKRAQRRSLGVYRRFVSASSPHMINLPSHVSNALHEQFAGGGYLSMSAAQLRDVFTDAQRVAFELMRDDVFLRFKRSQLYHALAAGV